MKKTYAKLHMNDKRIMSVLLLDDTEMYLFVQVVKCSMWNTNDFIKVSKSLIKKITDKI